MSVCLPVRYAEERSERVKGWARETKKKKNRGISTCEVYTYIPEYRSNGVCGYFYSMGTYTPEFTVFINLEELKDSLPYHS